MTVCTSTTRRRTSDVAITMGAAPTRSALRTKSVPSPPETSVNHTPSPATRPSATTTSAMRQSWRLALEAASAASRVAPWRTTATNGTQWPVGPEARKTNVTSRSSNTTPKRAAAARWSPPAPDPPGPGTADGPAAPASSLMPRARYEIRRLVRRTLRRTGPARPGQWWKDSPGSAGNEPSTRLR